MLKTIGNLEAAYRYAVGLQEALIITSVPVGAETLVGRTLLGSTLAIAGVYTCVVDITALTRLAIDLMATIGAGTMPTTSGGTTYYDQTTQKIAFTGVGLMVTATRQTLTLAAANLNGEKVANLIITLPAASSCTFTQAEITGKQ